MGGGLIAGAVALVLAGGLAIGAARSVVNTVNDEPVNSDASVVDYGSTTPASE